MEGILRFEKARVEACGDAWFDRNHDASFRVLEVLIWQKWWHERGKLWHDFEDNVNIVLCTNVKS